jgi:hypothetical protein
MPRLPDAVDRRAEQMTWFCMGSIVLRIPNLATALLPEMMARSRAADRLGPRTGPGPGSVGQGRTYNRDGCTASALTAHAPILSVRNQGVLEEE